MHNIPHTLETKLKLRHPANETIDQGDYFELILTDLVGNEVARTKIDKTDYPQVREYRWFLANTGYACSRRLNKLLHSFLMGTPPVGKTEIDHINIDKLDNRRVNLRFATPALNAINKNSKGIYFNKLTKKWISEVAGKYLGSFIKKEEAQKRSNNYRLELIKQRND